VPPVACPQGFERRSVPDVTADDAVLSENPHIPCLADDSSFLRWKLVIGISGGSLWIEDEIELRTSDPVMEISISFSGSRVAARS
jgi:hypothetical protein